MYGVSDSEWNTINADGSGFVKLFSLLSGEVISDPLWSPDSTQLLFDGYLSDINGFFNTTEIYVIDANGGDLINLTNTPDQTGGLAENEGRPLWSPDGSQILFSMNPKSDPTNLLDYELYVMPSSGGGYVNITNSNRDDFIPDYSEAWSPSGNKIAFQTSRVLGSSQIYTMTSGGGDVKDLVPGDVDGFEEHMAWSPDETKIAFTSAIDLVGSNDHAWEVYVIDADSTNLVNLSDHPAVDFSPVWAPDGSRIFFWSDRDGEYQIYSVNPDGTDLKNVTNNSGRVMQFGLSTDGNMIAYINKSTTDCELFVADQDGNNPKKIYNETAFVCNDDLAWRPNGS